MFRQSFERTRRSGTHWLAFLAASFILAGWNSTLLAQRRRFKLLPAKTRQVTTSLTLIRPCDADFDAMLDSYFPGVSGVPYFQSMRPYLVLVRNDSAVPAVAYTIHWSLIYHGGTVKTLRDDFILSPLGYGPNVTLPPEAIRLVSPKFNFTPREFRAISTFAERRLTYQFPPTVGLVSSAAELDGVVYRDHTYSGPEGPQIWRGLTVARLAAHDEALYVLNFLDSATPPQSLYSTLDLQVQRGLSEHGTDTMSMYVYARGQSAKVMEILLQRNEREKTIGLLRRIVNSSQPQGTFTFLGNRY